MSALAYLAIALAIFVSGVAGGIRWHAGQDAIAANAAHHAAAKEAAMRTEHVDQAATAHEADKAELRTEFITITKEVARVVEKPVYRDGVCFDDDGMRVVRSAIAAASAPSQPSGALPGSGRAR